MSQSQNQQVVDLQIEQKQQKSQLSELVQGGDSLFTYYHNSDVRVSKQESDQSLQQVESLIDISPNKKAVLNHSIEQQSNKHSLQKKESNAQKNISHSQQGQRPVAKTKHQKLETATKQEQKVQKPAHDSKLQMFHCQTSAKVNSPSSKIQQDPQLQQDLNALKKSYAARDKKKKTFSHQLQEHARLNKTGINVKAQKKKKYDQMESSSLDEKRMLLKMAISKKAENYKKLIQWDKKRAQALALHQNIVLNLQSEVNKRIKASIQNFDIYMTFFKQKVKQQQKYCNFPVTDTRKALANNNVSKSVFINCSIILNSLNDERQEKCKKIADFVNLIKKDIIKHRMEQHINQSQKELMKLRQRISSLKATLQKVIAQTQTKTKELMEKVMIDEINIKNIKVYQNEKPNSIGVHHQHDFYQLQLEFLASAEQQLKVQKNLGLSCVQYYNSAIRQEHQRSSTIRQAMLTFSKGLKETYNIELEQQQVQQLSKSQQSKLISELYALDQFFDERSLKVFRQHLKIPNQEEILASQIFNYIGNFRYDQFNSRMLLLKQFDVTILSSSQQESCYVVITVDCFLHLFIRKQSNNQYTKPDITCKINDRTLEIKDIPDCKVQIHKKSQRKGSMMSYFWEQKPEAIYRLRFSKHDSKEQFMDYMKKITQ